MKRHVLLAVAASLALPAAAAAAAAEGTGVDIAHVKNVPYPDLHAPDEQNAGTDLEFATLTVQPAAAAAAQSAPGASEGAPTSVPPAAQAPATAGPKPRSKAKAKVRTKRVCKVKRVRGKRKKLCWRAKVRDAKPRVAGLQRTFAFAGSYGDGLHVIDVTDPAQATRVATWDCGVSQGDVQLFARDGRQYAAYTHDDGYDLHIGSACAREAGVTDASVSGTFIADVTDPYAPKTVSFVPIEQGSHNVTVHPSGQWLYNSNSDLITSLLPAIEVIDIRDLRAPKAAGEVALKTFPGLGTESHDLSFSADGTRAYVAALSHGEVLDTTDPAAPKPLGVVVDPALTVWHQADAITIDDPVLGEREFLIAEDEVAGAAPTGQCPNGGVHVYDITGDRERTPVKVGYWNIADVGPTEDGLGTCTAHVFQLHREERLMTIAYYNGGVRVVDLSGLVGVALGRGGIGMRELGSFRFPDSDTWAVKAPFASRDGFHLYGNDHRRGFDVYRWKPGSTSSSSATRSRGTWLTPDQALVAARRAVRTGEAPKTLALCLLELQRRQ